MLVQIGKVAQINESEQVTETFLKKVVLVEIATSFQPQLIAFEFVNANIKLVDGIKVGDEVRVHFNLNCSSWMNRAGKRNYSVSLRPVKVDNISIPTTADAMKVFSPASISQTVPVENKQPTVDDLLINL